MGAPGLDERGEDSGAAYVFVRDGRGEWVQRQTLLADELAPYDHFGWSVAIDGDLLVVVPQATGASVACRTPCRRVGVPPTSSSESTAGGGR